MKIESYLALIAILSLSMLSWSQTPTSAPQMLTLKDAEALALKNNPVISEAKLNALASQQQVREVHSSLWPQVYANLTAVDANEGSRIAAGGLNNPVLYNRAAAGTTVSQLITDFGHTANLVSSSRLHAQAQEQNSIATQQQILLAVDQLFYAMLQSKALLKVAEQTVASRQLLTDQISALTRSKLKSDLDLSFANVNLAQAKLLLLDAQNNQKAAMASLNAILGSTQMQDYDVVEDPTPVTTPPPGMELLTLQALQLRPELLAQDYEVRSAEKFRIAQKDLFLPSIQAMGVVGDAPIRNNAITSWYGAVGVNVQVPIFNGFLFSAREHEADLRAQAERSRLADLRNRIARDVRNSWLNANTAFDRMNVTKQLFDSANLALDLAQTRYKLGLSSIVELSQAQLQQTQAEIVNAQAQYDYRYALAVLNYQIAVKL